jgi:hypothetical protein
MDRPTLSLRLLSKKMNKVENITSRNSTHQNNESVEEKQEKLRGTSPKGN